MVGETPPAPASSTGVLHIRDLSGDLLSVPIETTKKNLSAQEILDFARAARTNSRKSSIVSGSSKPEPPAVLLQLFDSRAEQYVDPDEQRSLQEWGMAEELSLPQLPTSLDMEDESAVVTQINELVPRLRSEGPGISAEDLVRKLQESHGIATNVHAVKRALKHEQVAKHVAPGPKDVDPSGPKDDHTENATPGEQEGAHLTLLVKLHPHLNLLKMLGPLLLDWSYHTWFTHLDYIQEHKIEHKYDAFVKTLFTSFCGWCPDLATTFVPGDLPAGLTLPLPRDWDIALYQLRSAGFEKCREEFDLLNDPKRGVFVKLLHVLHYATADFSVGDGLSADLMLFIVSLVRLVELLIECPDFVCFCWQRDGEFEDYWRFIEFPERVWVSSEKKTVCERGCFNQLRDIMRRIGGVYSEEEDGVIRMTWKKNVGGVLSIFRSRSTDGFLGLC